MFLAPWIALAVLLGDLRHRAEARARRDDGAVTLEQVVITSALLAAAIAVGALIVKAITSRAESIS
jgi:hypothetical protein